MKIDLGRPVPATMHEASDAATFLASVAAAVKDLGLPLSSPVHAYFYPTQAAFEIGLVSDARWSVDLARAAAVSSWGVGTYYGILLREDKFRETSLRNRVWLVAHELTHVSQFEMTAGRHTTSDQWLREGFADWVGAMVVERLGIRPYRETRDAILQSFKRTVVDTEDLPSLDSLVRFRDWVAAHNERGFVRTYNQAFFAVEWLIERWGRDAVLAYFRRFGTLDDREGNFEASFRMSFDQFVDAFRLRLTELLAR